MGDDAAEEVDLTETELVLVRALKRYAAQLPPDPVTPAEGERARALMVRAGVTGAEVDEATVVRLLRAYDRLLHA